MPPGRRCRPTVLAMSATAATTARAAFRVPDQPDLAADRPAGPSGRAAGQGRRPRRPCVELGDRLDELQEALYAEATGGGRRSLLLVLQGMDTSGKGGVIRARRRPGQPAGPADRLVQAADPGGAARTTSCGASANSCRDRAGSACSTARTTRTCWWSGSTGWSRSRSGGSATGRSTRSRPSSRRRAPRRQVHAAHLPGGAGRAAAGPARRPGQALEVQPGRPRRPGQVAGLPAGLHRRAARDATPTPRPGT